MLIYPKARLIPLPMIFPIHKFSRLIQCVEITPRLYHSSKMPAFTLYGSRGSTNTDRVRLTLAEGGFTDYELVLLNLQKGEQKVRDIFLWRIHAASTCMSENIPRRALKISSLDSVFAFS